MVITNIKTIIAQCALIFAVTIAFLTSCEKKRTYTIETSLKSTTALFAQEELKTFLTPALDFNFVENNADADFIFQFREDSALQETAFSIKRSTSDNQQRIIEFSGYSDSEILPAVYTFLEDGGYIFEVTGPIPPKEFLLLEKKDVQDITVPAVKWRGIRQHINFPMDISSYPLIEAKEYVRNLGRMGFNAMVYHSYLKQWYEYPEGDSTSYAGHFFYGDVHRVPDELSDFIQNDDYFCIPSIEPYFNDKPKRSRLAIAWLQELIHETQRIGMKTQLSIELRDTSLNLDKSKAICKSVLKDYPMIDAFELITNETGGWGPRCTEQETKSILKGFFGEDILNDLIVTSPIRAEQSDLATIYGELGHNIAVIKMLREEEILPETIESKIGIYCAVTDYTKSVFYLARKFAPEIETCLMPGHHSAVVLDNLKEVVKSPEDLNNTTIYAWVEFDGMMYVQQNESEAISELIKWIDDKNGAKNQINALYFNHWRNAENRITIRYAAQACLFGALNYVDYYTPYAHKIGIENKKDFALAMHELEQADRYYLKNNPADAFCWIGRWRDGGPLANTDAVKLANTKELYEKVLITLKKCVTEKLSNEGNELIAMLDNRIRTSILYLRAFDKMRETQILAEKENFSSEDRAKYVDICNQTIKIFKQYIDLYQEKNIDRGCEGLLMSLYVGPLRGVKVYREKIGHIPLEEKPITDTPIDAPPLPIVKGD